MPNGLNRYLCLQTGGQVTSRYMLLARREGKNRNMADLCGKSLNVFAVANANAHFGIHWLQALLQEHKLNRPEQFFGALQYQSEPMHTVLPVFLVKRMPPWWIPENLN